MDSNGIQNPRGNDEKQLSGGAGGDCWPSGTNELLSIWMLALDESARRDLLSVARDWVKTEA